jgi:RNA polymerase sigma-70 factor (ECF subfamily)
MVDRQSPGAERRAHFPSTQWTDILDARGGDTARRREALERLVETYWKPVYFLVRRRGHDAEAAKDFTQGFFTAFIEKDFLKYVDRGRGKFRIFLRTALEHYLADERDRALALKRGGTALHVSLDFAEAEVELAATAADEDPDRLFARKWAVAVMKRALDVLRADYAAAGRAVEFEVLAARLVESAGPEPSYEELARRLGVSETDVNNRLHRLRRLYRDAIWNELRAATESDAQAEDELAGLFTAWQA